MRSCLLAIAFTLISLAGCSTPPTPRRPEPSPAPPRPAPDTRATVVGQTLIYPCRWGRAEDLASTLEPYLVNRYGPGVRIVPQAQSNSLLIYVPSHREQEQERAGRRTAGAPTVR